MASDDVTTVVPAAGRLAPDEAARRAGQAPPIRVRTFAHAATVLRGKGFVVATHLGVGNEAYTGGSVQTLDGEPHFERRRLLAPLFDARARSYYETVILPPALERAIASATSGSTSGEPVEVDLVPLLRETIVQISARVIGLDGVSRLATARTLLRLADTVVPAVSARWSKDREGIVRAGDEARAAFIRDFVAPARERRRRLLAEGRAPEPPDLLTLVLRGEPDDAEEDGIWVIESIVLLAASLGTTMQSTLRAVAQLADWVAADPGRAPLLSDLRFLRRAAAEAVRLHPPIPEMVRIAVEDVRLDAEGPAIPAGTTVEVDPFDADRDPDVFAPEPGAFDPFRDVPPRLRDFGVSFGGGPHMCSGQRMAIELAQTVGDDAAAPVGVVPRLLLGLYRAGLKLDPSRPPTLLEGNTQGKYTTFPASLTRV
jgi:cytochrome P450